MNGRSLRDECADEAYDKRRHGYICAALTGLCANPNVIGGDNPAKVAVQKLLARCSLVIADAVIEAENDEDPGDEE